MDKEAPQLKAFSISTEQKQTLTEPCQPRGPKPKYLPAIQKVLEEQKGELTDRQIFYRLVSKGIIANSTATYNQVCHILKVSRVNGTVSWDRIVDRSKPIYQVDERSCGSYEDYFEYHTNRYETAEKTLRDAPKDYYVPLWSFQLEHVEVWCEKDALAGVLQQVTDKWMLPLVVCRGYQSITNIHDRLGIYRDRVSHNKKVTILYFGDYDPRGENIPEVIQRDFQSLGFQLNLTKIALTEQQVKQYSLIPAPCKKKDTMANQWISQHGDMVFELDALEPSALLQVVEESIKAHFSHDACQRREECIENGKQELARLTSEYFGEGNEDEKEESTAI